MLTKSSSATGLPGFPSIPEHFRFLLPFTPDSILTADLIEACQRLSIPTRVVLDWIFHNFHELANPEVLDEQIEELLMEEVAEMQFGSEPSNQEIEDWYALEIFRSIVMFCRRAGSTLLQWLAPYQHLPQYVAIDHVEWYPFQDGTIVEVSLYEDCDPWERVRSNSTAHRTGSCSV